MAGHRQRYHSVWNAGNCDVYVLRKDLSKPGAQPYVLDKKFGDVPRSSIDVMIESRLSGEKKILKLKDYLSVPPPRTTRLRLVKQMLQEQYPDEVDANDVKSIVFMPFVEGPVIKGRSTSGVSSSHGRDSVDDDDFRTISRHHKQEKSLRYPCIKPGLSWD
jgi:hypothetical protein